MIENIELATNEELTEESKRLYDEYEDTKTVLANAYQRMKDLSEQYQKITAVLNRRNGNHQ